MKKCLLLVVAAIAIFFFATSCVNGPQAMIQAQAKAANRSCPMEIGNGLTLTKVEFEGRYVVYYYKGEDMYFSQENVTPEMKAQIVQALQLQAQSDTNTKKFIEALKKGNVGIIYHYFSGSDSVMDVVIEAIDLEGNLLIGNQPIAFVDSTKNNQLTTTTNSSSFTDSNTLQFVVNGVTFNMKFVKGGVFKMGATTEQGTDINDNEKPIHNVEVNSFYIGETEVTQALWFSVMNTRPSWYGGWSDEYGLGNDYPAYCVSYDEVVTEFIPKLNQITGEKFEQLDWREDYT